MPIWLRKYTFNKILDFHKQKNNSQQNDVVEQSIKNMKSAGSVNNKKIQVPDYVTKASKK
jgi:hypothetical protein